MLKVVVFDSGYGGEFFADQLQDEVPIIDIIRVIDWRNADKILISSKEARKTAINALRPYIGKVDLIIFANYLLTANLKYFRRKFKDQKFIGLHIKTPDTFIKRDTLILTTKAFTKTRDYHDYLTHLKRRTKSLALDTWPAKIDDGELTKAEIEDTLSLLQSNDDFSPQEIILTCSQFNDIKPELREYFGHNIKIYDSFKDTIREACKALKIRGGVGKKAS